MALSKHTVNDDSKPATSLTNATPMPAVKPPPGDCYCYGYSPGMHSLSQAALDIPGSYEHCSRFTLKSLRRRLSRQAGFDGQDRDPLLAAAAALMESDSLATLDNINIACWCDSLLPEQFDDDVPADLFGTVQEYDGEADGWDVSPNILLSEGDDNASASPHTFARFYELDVTASTLARAVLSVGSAEGHDSSVQ